MFDYTRWLNGSTASRDEGIFAGLYAELHRITRGRMAAERAGQTLDATALVHEAWLRLEKSAPEQWRDRQQFYGAAADAMRRILVEAARRRLAAKRGGGHEAMLLEDTLPVAAPMVDERLLYFRLRAARREGRRAQGLGSAGGSVSRVRHIRRSGHR